MNFPIYSVLFMCGLVAGRPQPVCKAKRDLCQLLFPNFAAVYYCNAWNSLHISQQMHVICTVLW